MAIKFTNNAVSSLLTGISNVATSLTVVAGEGARFPILSGGDYFRVTLIAGSSMEIVKVTARSSDIMTIVRAEEGTTALAFASGAYVSLYTTAQDLYDLAAERQPTITTVGILKGAGAGAISAATAGTDYTTPAGTENLTNKTVTAVALRETKVAMSALNLDLATGNAFSKTAGGSMTFTVSNVPATGNFVGIILDLINGGSTTITWWSGVKWAGGIAPQLTPSSGRDTLGFFTHDGGSTWTGLVLDKDIK